ncbi:MAG: UDP-3-O-(3-hydroxymyristoyl)glucosamine N-acyltransferase [Bacteroidia bacterium]
MKLTKHTTLAEAAAVLGTTFIGEANHIIQGFNEIHCVQKGDVTFVDVAKYYDKALNSAATTIIINQEVIAPEGKALILHPEPFTAYNLLTEHYQPRISVAVSGEPKLGENVQMGRNVVMGNDVSIGKNTEIGHNVVIGSKAKIGEGCIIYPNVTINEHCIIGDFVCINAGTVIGGEAFYFKSRNESKEKLLTKGRVIIENHVDIGANCTIDRGVSGDTIIGEYTKLDNLVQIGHDTVIGKRCLLAAQVGVAGVVTLEDDVILWGQVGVNKDLTIGKGAILFGKTGVMSSLEGGKKYLGMIANEHRNVLKQEVALRKLPDVLQKMEAFLKKQN